MNKGIIEKYSQERKYPNVEEECTLDEILADNILDRDKDLLDTLETSLE